MKTVSLQITYRKGKPFAAYIYLSPPERAKKVSGLKPYQKIS